jgi:hypothetical protein
MELGGGTALAHAARRDRSMPDDSARQHHSDRKLRDNAASMMMMAQWIGPSIAVITAWSARSCTD